MNGWVGENVNVVSDFDVHEVLRETGETVLTVFLGEHVARAGADTEGVWHFGGCLNEIV